MKMVWRVMIGVCGAGLLSCLLLREVPMRKDMDERWALQQNEEREKDQGIVLEEGKRADISRPGTVCAIEEAE